MSSSDNPWHLSGPRAARHRARIVGKGSELIVFSHGLGTDQSVWDALLAHLPARYCALLFDLPGAGPLLPADFDPNDYRSISAFADDLLALLDEVGVERCTYLGHSVSGMIGVLASIEHPAIFERLILLNASPRYLNDEDYHGGFTQPDLENLFAAMSGSYQAWVAGFAPAVIAAEVPEAVEEFSRGLLAMRPDVTVRIARTIFETDVRALLPLVQVPTLLISSRGDMAVPEAVGEYLAAHIPDSKLVWIESAGHLPHLSAPDELLAVLREHGGW